MNLSPVTEPYVKELGLIMFFKKNIETNIGHYVLHCFIKVHQKRNPVGILKGNLYFIR